jgi:hypothetical protein
MPSGKPDVASACDAPSTASGEPGGHGPRRIDYERWLAYLAGYIDGEGCFRWNGGPYIEISNTYPHTLFEVRRTFGGGVRKRASSKGMHRTTWVWWICGQAARDTAEMCLPFLMEKRRQAEILLEAGRFPARSARREVLLEELVAIKRIDYGRLESC